jgi:RimJ/RimL family protein N-acetyltransferase
MTTVGEPQNLDSEHRWLRSKEERDVSVSVSGRPSVRIEAWGPDDLSILERSLRDPAMTEHIGGPESAEKIAERQSRYEQRGSGQFKIVLAATGESVGWVGYWERNWRQAEVNEIGWAVLPPFQGRGVAAAATALAVARIRADGKRRFVHAFPSVDNAPSNGVCRKLSFELLGEIEFEYPLGNLMECNDWRLDVSAS